ncbi:MAG TPA: polysaccharide biosynthesis/export family protein [Candidatus Dormibacteraeota bacterium]|nr:polysaccharide biosynthesis/export family protein [Candidatus Dormibacteraeota bacterium]
MEYKLWFHRAAWLGLALTLACAAQAREKRTDAASRVAPAHAEYVIGPEDVLAIDIWHEPEISRVEPVRPDGKITLPLVGEIKASGETTRSLQSEIAARLTHYIHQPAVTVIVQQANSRRFNIIGDVLRPGSYSLNERTSVLDAIAVAGGFGEFAKVTRIYIVRTQPGGSSQRILFNYKDAVRGDERDLDLALQPGDTVIVP